MHGGGNDDAASDRAVRPTAISDADRAAARMRLRAPPGRLARLAQRWPVLPADPSTQPHGAPLRANWRPADAADPPASVADAWLPEIHWEKFDAPLADAGASVAATAPVLDVGTGAGLMKGPTALSRLIGSGPLGLRALAAARHERAGQGDRPMAAQRSGPRGAMLLLLPEWRPDGERASASIVYEHWPACDASTPTAGPPGDAVHGALRHQHIAAQALGDVVEQFCHPAGSGADRSVAMRMTVTLADGADAAVHVVLREARDRRHALMLVLPAAALSLSAVRAAAESALDMLSFLFASPLSQSLASPTARERADSFFERLYARILSPAPPSTVLPGEPAVVSTVAEDALTPQPVEAICISPGLRDAIDRVLCTLEAAEREHTVTILHEAHAYLPLGTLLLYCGRLVRSHMTDEDTRLCYAFCVHYRLLEHPHSEPTLPFVVWREVFGDRWSAPDGTSPIAVATAVHGDGRQSGGGVSGAPTAVGPETPYRSDGRRRFLLAVSQQEAVLCVLLERNEEAAEPLQADPLYVSEAKVALHQLYADGRFAQILREVQANAQMPPTTVVDALQPDKPAAMPVRRNSFSGMLVNLARRYSSRPGSALPGAGRTRRASDGAVPAMRDTSAAATWPSASPPRTAGGETTAKCAAEPPGPIARTATLYVMPAGIRTAAPQVCGPPRMLTPHAQPRRGRPGRSAVAALHTRGCGHAVGAAAAGLRSRLAAQALGSAAAILPHIPYCRRRVAHHSGVRISRPRIWPAPGRRRRGCCGEPRRPDAGAPCEPPLDCGSCRAWSDAANNRPVPARRTATGCCRTDLRDRIRRAVHLAAGTGLLGFVRLGVCAGGAGYT